MDDELRGIGEMARASGLSVSALRFYDRTGLLVPAAVDPVTGYRRYTADQVSAAVLVAGMRRIGMPLADIVVVLERRRDPAVAREVLDGHVRRLEEELDDAHREVRRLTGLLDPGEPGTSGWPVASVSVDVGAAELARAIDTVRFAMSGDRHCPELCGVLIEADRSSVHVAATDRYRLAVYEAPARHRTGSRARAVLAAHALGDIRAAGRATRWIDGGHGRTGVGCHR